MLEGPLKRTPERAAAVSQIRVAARRKTLGGEGWLIVTEGRLEIQGGALGRSFILCIDPFPP